MFRVRDAREWVSFRLIRWGIQCFMLYFFVRRMCLAVANIYAMYVAPYTALFVFQFIHSERERELRIG